MESLIEIKSKKVDELGGNFSFFKGGTRRGTIKSVS